ncbi:MAG: hypothetical protein WCI95_00495 [bacterium]
MTSFLRLLAFQFLAMTALVQAADDKNIIAEVTGRFHPTKPAVMMNYDVTYVLFNISLKRVAEATLKATEGVWCSNLSTGGVPACLIDFQVESPRTGDAADDNIRLFKRTVSVLTMPELKIITYAKHNDEFIKPFFSPGRRMSYVEIYNFEAGTPTYRHHDLFSGTVETNLPGMADLAKQSTEVANVFQTLYAAYSGQPAPHHARANTVHFNVDGTVRTFDLKMKKGRVSALALPGKFSALYADIQPEKDSDGRNESFSMWCVPFRQFAHDTSDPELKKLAKTSLEWSMLPLSGEYGLFLGAIQCTLTKICVQPQG